MGETISYAWNTYWKNVGPMLIIVVVVAVITAIVGVIANLASGDSVVLSLVLGVVAWLVGLFLALGVIRAALAVTAGRTPEVGMLFESPGYGPYIVGSILFGIGLYIGLLLCIVPGIYWAMVFGFFGYFIADGGEHLSGTDAMKASAEITRGKRGELFLLHLALFGINLVGALLCGVGLLFTAGISAIAIAHAYRTLKGQPIVQPI